MSTEFERLSLNALKLVRKKNEFVDLTAANLLIENGTSETQKIVSGLSNNRFRRQLQSSIDKIAASCQTEDELLDFHKKKFGEIYGSKPNVGFENKKNWFDRIYDHYYTKFISDEDPYLIRVPKIVLFVVISFGVIMGVILSPVILLMLYKFLSD